MLIRELLAWQSFDTVKKNMPSHSVGSHVSKNKSIVFKAPTGYNPC